MKNLVTGYFTLTAVLAFVFCMSLMWVLPDSVQAIEYMSDSGDIGGSGDPNDEQDFSGGNGGSGGSGGYDDEYQDGYWGAPSGVFGVPLIIFDGKLMLIIPSLDQSMPIMNIFILSESIPPQGDQDAR